MQVRKRDTSRIYALKTIRKQHIVERGEITHTLAERLVLARVNNPFIVPLKFSFQSAQKLYLVLAYVVFIACVRPQLNPVLASSTAENFSTIYRGNSGSTRNVVASTAQNSCLLSNTSTNLMLFIGMSLHNTSKGRIAYASLQ